MTMPLTKRPGLFASSESSRVYDTEPAAALAFVEMKTRPVVVAAHSVPVSLAVRAIAATFPPERAGVPLQSDEVSRVDGTPFPMITKSPQAGFAKNVVNSGQLASRYAWLPPQSCVRQMLSEPWKIAPAYAGFGSAMMGG